MHFSYIFEQKMIESSSDSCSNSCEFSGDTLKLIQKYFETDRIKIHNVIIVEEKKHFLSQIKRCVINGTEIEKFYNKKKEFSKNIFIKQIIENEYFAEIFNSRLAFRNEYFSYSKILPTLNQYSRKSLQLPECFGCTENLLILEDLKGNGYQHLDPLTGFTMEIVELILRELANLHGASLAMKQTDAGKFNEITTLVQEILFTEKDNSLLKTQLFRIDMALKLFDHDRRIVEYLTKIRNTLPNLFRTLIRRSTIFDVITHGDLWLTNILFKDNQIKFIDFQLMRLCSPAADLSYFFYVNLDPKFLIEHYDQLLQIYLNQLLMNLSDFPWVIENFTIDWLKSEMDQFRVFGFIHGLWIMPMFFIKQQNPINEQEFQDNAEITVEDAFKKMSERELDRFTRLVEYCVK